MFTRCNLKRAVLLTKEHNASIIKRNFLTMKRSLPTIKRSLPIMFHVLQFTSCFSLRTALSIEITKCNAESCIPESAEATSIPLINFLNLIAKHIILEPLITPPCSELPHITISRSSKPTSERFINSLFNSSFTNMLVENRRKVCARSSRHFCAALDVCSDFRFSSALRISLRYLKLSLTIV